MFVAIVDDDPVSLRLMERLVALTGHEAAAFQSISELLAAIDTLPYGCILLDINMPDQNGLDALVTLQQRDLAWPVVMVSGTTELNDAIVAFRRGAVHFLRKPFRCEALGQALLDVSGVVAARLRDHERAVAARSIMLTPREREVLGAMGEGEQTKVIAWRLGLSVRTVDMHRTNILAKLGARNAVQAVARARELGLIAAQAA